MAAKLISIIGPVAVGKTTLAEALAQALAGEVLHEDYAGNPFLAESFTARAELMLASQVYFLLSRVRQLTPSHWPKTGLYISDYGFCQDRIFASLSLGAEDIAAYDSLAARLAPLVHPPELLIHLDAPVETLLERIARRGRAYEKTAFDRDFLESLRRANAAITPPEGGRIIRLDAGRLDFRKPAELAEVLGPIEDALGE